MGRAFMNFPDALAVANADAHVTGRRRVVYRCPERWVWVVREVDAP